LSVRFSISLVHISDHLFECFEIGFQNADSEFSVVYAPLLSLYLLASALRFPFEKPDSRIRCQKESPPWVAISFFRLLLAITMLWCALPPISQRL
jgi:hypothetical protein